MENNRKMSAEQQLLENSFILKLIDQLGERVNYIRFVQGTFVLKVEPIGWIEKETWREINDILRLNGFCWMTNGRNGFWGKQLEERENKIEM